MSHAHSIRLAASPALAATLTLTLAACNEPAATGAVGPAAAPRDSRADAAGAHRQYGTPVRVGRGRARAYVVYDHKAGGAPLEVGVALDERALDGLRGPRPTAPGDHGGHGEHEHLDSDVFLLALPPRGAAPYRFVELDWNPGGHEPPGVYDVPHFDFHFWTTSEAERATIVPSNPRWAELAAQLPADAERPAHFAVAAPAGTPPAAVAVPLMGVHWADVRTPELQPPGSPAHRPFTTTFLWGSWAGRFVFLEPMITRAHVLSKRTAADPAARDEVIALPRPARVGTPGHYPAAYRITWDAHAKEYRIALTQLERRG
jgi:hypothetical protein